MLVPAIMLAFVALNSNAQMHSFYSNFIPQATDPLMTVNVRFYIFSPSQGQGVWDQVTAQDCQIAVNDANWRLANNPPAKVLPSGVTDIVDTRIRLNVSGVHYITDDNYYLSIPLQHPNSYTDPNSIDVYLKYGTIDGSTRSYFSTHGAFIQFMSTSNNNIAGKGVTLLHEVGHMLGLKHANTGEPWPEDNRGCGAFGVWDYARNNYVNWVQCSGAYNNNLMHTDGGCNENLSPGQMAFMHYNLRTRFANCLVNTSYGPATERDPNADYVVNQNEVWSDPKYMEGNVTINTGKTLKITCHVAMTHGAKITVQTGAQLIIDGGTITNLSGRTWEGIEVLGDPSLPHTVSDPNNPGCVLNQGIVRLLNGATISHASTGIRDHNGLGQNSTGIIFCTDATFLNNEKDVWFYNPPSAYVNVSYFANSTFKIDNIIGDGLTPGCRFLFFESRGVQIRGCTLEFAGNGAYLNSEGIGILSYNADFTVNKNVSIPTAIIGFDYGILALNANPLTKPTINNTYFNANRSYGAYIQNNVNMIFEDNTITNPSNSASIGLYLDRCKYYKIKHNSFTEISTINLSTGLDVFRSLDGAHEVYKNNFSMLGMGINAFDNNNSPANSTNHMVSTTGLKFNCNVFNSALPSNPNKYDIALTFTPSLTRPTVNKVQGRTDQLAGAMDMVRNLYGAQNCNNGNMFHADPSCTMTIEHGANTNSSSDITHPSSSCRSSQINSVDKGFVLDYEEDCPGNTPSSGGVFANLNQQISNLNTYASSLRAAADEGADVLFELQATIATKVNCFLSDTSAGAMDSVITIYDQNQGSFSDADILAIFACMKVGRFDDAEQRIANLGAEHENWAIYLEQLVALEQAGGLYVLNSDQDLLNFFEGIADTDNAEGQGSAISLLKAVIADYDYVPPHPVPVEELAERKKRPDDIKDETAQNILQVPGVQAYPNPTKNNLNILYLHPEGTGGEYELRDLPGRLIQKGKVTSGHNEVSLNAVSSGMYMLRVNDVNGQQHYQCKFVIQD